jgi:hypothetical protein
MHPPRDAPAVRRAPLPSSPVVPIEEQRRPILLERDIAHDVVAAWCPAPDDDENACALSPVAPYLHKLPIGSTWS